MFGTIRRRRRRKAGKIGSLGGKVVSAGASLLGMGLRLMSLGALIWLTLSAARGALKILSTRLDGDSEIPTIGSALPEAA